MQCCEKVQYESKRDAKHAVHRCRTNFRRGLYPDRTEDEFRRLNAYRCPECRLWHIGKSSVRRHAFRSLEQFLLYG